MVTATTQIQKKKEFVKKAGISDKTIVEVVAGKYPVFTNDSVFDCNEIFEVNITDLIRKIEENGSMNYPKLPDNILRQIIVGINESPKISPAIKDLM